jgi:two-component system sensor histidine kinase AlgZ
MAVEAGLLCISIRNPVPPLPAGETAAAGAQHAQRSIGHRLAYAFGPRAVLTATRDAGCYRCELRIPLATTQP